MEEGAEAPSETVEPVWVAALDGNAAMEEGAEAPSEALLRILSQCPAEDWNAAMEEGAEAPSESAIGQHSTNGTRWQLSPQWRRAQKRPRRWIIHSPAQ